MIVHSGPDLRRQARVLSLLRLLLLAIGLGAVSIFAGGAGAEAVAALERARLLLVVVCVVAALLAMSVPWVVARWQLALHLVFDILWIGLLLYWTGGVVSTGVVLLFAVVLIGNMLLPGYLRFLHAALAGMVLSVVAAFYLSGHSPFPPEVQAAAPEMFAPGRVLGGMTVQVVALFLVDLLAGVLAGRVVEGRLFAGGVLDQLGEGVIAVDRARAVTYANAEAMRLLGLPAPPPPGTAADALLAGETLAPMRALLWSERLPALARAPGTGGRQLVLRAGQLRGRDGGEIGRVLVIADETRLRLLEDGARRSEALAALGEMAAGIAHEVRNPLTSLRGCAQELAEVAESGGRGDDARLARIIVDESDRLARIVNDFLALSRMRPPSRREVVVEDLLREAALLLGARADLPAGTAVEVRCDPGLPRFNADPDQLRQVVLNLGVNALEALRERPSPRVLLSAGLAGDDNPLDGDALRLGVADNGHGIQREHLASVSTPFWSSKPQGTGLGLSVVARIVKDHEGAMRIDSEPGSGTEVVLFLPLTTQTRAFKRALGGA